MATVVKKVKRAGKRASKYQFTANFQSVVVECVKEKWLPHELSVAWSRRGRRHYTNSRLWKASPDNHKRGVVVWPELEEIEITVTLYKGQKDKKFELKEWEFAVIDMDETGKRKILATTTINMADYVSHLGLDKDLLLKLRPVSKKIKLVTLAVNMQSTFIKEGKATDDDMQSIASNLSCSKLSIIGVLEDGSMNSRSPGGSFQDENGSRPVTPVIPPALIESQDELIKWAKRMTVGYRGLKITNMTTSWRNGLGFLAIIHHFRPDMVDYNELSAINVKQNNHLTCLLARELGISCTISPDHMVNATIPDKLAIASFVYQLYSFFNENIPSAVTPVSNIPMLPGNGMEDFDKITMAKLNSESSLVNNPSDQPKASSDRVNKYSRHRLENDIVIADQQLVNDNITTTSNGVAAELFPIVHAPGSNGVDENSNEETSDNVDEMFPKVGGSSAVKEDAPTNEAAVGDIPDVVVNSPTDESILSRIRAKSPEHSIAIEKKITAEEITEDVVIVRRESSSQPAMPEQPSDNGASEGQGVINLDVTVNEITEAKKQPEQKENRRRKLPSLPNMDASSSQSLKERAQEIIKQASEGSISMPAQDEAREAALKERVQQMLISGKLESTSAISKRIVKTGGVRVLGRAAPKPQIHVVQNTVITQQQKTSDTSSSNFSADSIQVDEKPNHIENVQKENSEELQKDTPEKKNEKEELEKQNPEGEKVVKDKTEELNDKQENGKVQGTAQPKREPRKRRHHHMLSSEVKPVSKQPSASALSMASQPPTEKPVPVPRTIPISKTKSKEENDEEDMDNVNLTPGADERDEVCSTPPPDKGIHSPDSTQSPSAWTSLSTDLAESILYSRSEFVVAELKQLQVKLKELDQKAGLIELDLRNAMDQGNKEREEKLMKDWFQLLNEKNDVIRRQMELNLIEKEEDVERKEYLLRKELRTLSAITDDIKTQDQKDKEDKLLQELLKTVEERNSIEQRKMTTQAQKESETAGFVKAQSRSADLAKNNPASNLAANNNCIIS